MPGPRTTSPDVRQWAIGIVLISMLCAGTIACHGQSVGEPRHVQARAFADSGVFFLYDGRFAGDADGQTTAQIVHADCLASYGAYENAVPGPGSLSGQNSPPMQIVDLVHCGPEGGRPAIVICHFASHGVGDSNVEYRIRLVDVPSSVSLQSVHDFNEAMISYLPRVGADDQAMEQPCVAEDSD